jgi:hypothetical protein
MKMSVLGWILFLCGALLLLVGGIGFDTGIVALGRLANLPSLIAGSALMTCGAVFTGFGEVINILKKMPASSEPASQRPAGSGSSEPILEPRPRRSEPSSFG